MESGIGWAWVGGVGGRENTQAYALVGPSSSSNVLGGMEDEDVDVDGDV